MGLINNIKTKLRNWCFNRWVSIGNKAGWIRTIRNTTPLKLSTPFAESKLTDEQKLIGHAKLKLKKKDLLKNKEKDNEQKPKT
tara:strand:+ start:228 stop:476 length:249 start_codon:yes stop_codon:yes gene_type:complete